MLAVETVLNALPGMFIMLGYRYQMFNFNSMAWRKDYKAQEVGIILSPCILSKHVLHMLDSI
jgi:hypothetical protein